MLAAWMAERVGPSGQVVGIDPLAERIALARERVPGAQFQIGYAEDLGAFADGSFDGVCMSAVFHWVPDKPKALAAIARVLRPGGKLGFTTLPWELHAASTMAKVLGSVFAQPGYRERLRLEKFALAHQCSTVTELISMVLAAGLDLAELHVMERVRRMASAREMIDFMEASSFGNFLSAIPEELHDTFPRRFRTRRPGTSGSRRLRHARLRGHDRGVQTRRLNGSSASRSYVSQMTAAGQTARETVIAYWPPALASVRDAGYRG
jgi:arsenite methyltransferase